MWKILIAEDDEAISNLIKVNLTKAGYACTCASDGKEAADRMEREHFDLALFDIMLPYFNGYDLMDYASGLGLPVIFITAMDRVDQKVKGLKMGADDYITKPFDIVELLARVEVVLRRYHKTNDVMQIGDLTINLQSHTVTRNGQEIALTLKEFELLALFARNRNIALSRERIYENVWESDFMGQSRTVDLHVQRLKKKLGWDKEIKSVYKVGYRLEV